MSPRLPLFEDETVRSWLERLTAYHGPSSVEDLCRQLGINHEGLRHGERDDILRLSDITGESPALIRRNLISTTVKGDLRLGPHVLTAVLRPATDRRVCADCLKEDASCGPPTFYLRERWEWQLATSQKCNRHDRELTRIDPEDEHWREGFVQPKASRKKTIDTAPEDSRFHDWLRQELKQRSKAGWSADMSLPDAVDAAGVIGVTIGLGSNERWQDLDFARKRDALNLGHDLVCRDREALRPALLAQVERNGTSFGRGRNHGSPLGMLWSWMRHRRELAPSDPLTNMFFAILT
ncbi:TniQ family protein [Pseudogemmobacter faecipullorum]|uniref:TniQ family protein n=1 Tax=Pseudogemmobacter faecipullorum TaxID=2755041 RepID=A0ABS8CPA5_9RHOB|nr:TniQ family protein [Pseudogemmobacter faecipullorum]MCB5411231.1 TniQ family protein [Pseudogemmobacter faecipullorum]